MYEAASSTASTRAPAQHKQMEMKKPVFTGFAKLNVGTGDDQPGTRQYTYDMDSIRKSAASSKPTGPRPDGVPRKD